MASLNKINVGKIAKESMVLEVELTGMRLYKARLKLCVLIFRFGAWVAGVGIKVNVDG